MGFLSGKTVALGVSAGIAAYRACELARLLMKRGAKVRALMTPNATRFIAPLTFEALTGHPVLSDLFHSEATYGHLDTARTADLMIIAPATADLIARLRAGMADDAVTTSVLASSCPVLLAPAMNTRMWENHAVLANVGALLSYERFHLVGPASGTLADGDVGPGRLSEPADIVEVAESLLAPKDLAGWDVLVTAGPTREHLDPVRFLSNPSSGRMGFAVARAAAQRGAKVVLVAGPTELASPAGVEVVRVTSAQEMADATLPRLAGARLVVGAAAVADQRPSDRAEQKVKKTDGPESLSLVRTPDILAEAGRRKAKGQLLVGFAAETEKLVENARSKLKRKNLDLVAANEVGKPQGGFASTSTTLVLVGASGKPEPLEAMAKEDAAHALLDRVLKLAGGRSGRRRRQ